MNFNGINRFHYKVYYQIQLGGKDTVPKSKPLVFIYFTLSILGLLATWYYNFQYFSTSDSLNFGPYLKALLANSATTAVTIDIYFTAVVFSLWVLVESKRAGMKWAYIYILLCFGVGIAFSFPLFLAFREKKYQEMSSQKA
ncbi:DUF2834 domain-containing protein [Kiloniella laminariae]|uniref:DUF2834 domain-containing protein n=1 Tax=Kiloniella laminariae TaxID=454162 RepID=UPI0003800354